MDTTQAMAGHRERRAGKSAAVRRARRYWAVSLAAGAVIVVLTYFPILFVVSNSLKTGRSIFTSGVFALFTQLHYGNYVTAWNGVDHQLLNTYLALLMIPWTLTLIPLFLVVQRFGFFNTWWGLILPYAAGAQPLLMIIFRGSFSRSRPSSSRAQGSTAARSAKC